MLPHRNSSASEASSSSAHDSSQTNNLRTLVPASRPPPADTAHAYRTAPLTRKRVPITLACEPCRQKKIKCNGSRPTCSQCQARKIDCVYRQTAETNYRDKYEKLLESHPAAIVYRAIQTRPRAEALEIVDRIQSGIDAETLSRQLTSADLLLQVRLEPETRSRYQFIYSPLMPKYLQTTTNPFMKSLIHEWSDRDDASVIADLATESDLGYRAQYLRPHHAATIVDPRLDDIVPSKWTSVGASDSTMRELIRAYLLQEYDWFTFFQKDYFLDDMLSGSNVFCSSLLVNAILAVGCLMTVPVLQTPPRNTLPDPNRDPDWFGEIWLKYPSSSILIPMQVGVTFQTKMDFAVVLNEAMLDYHGHSTEDDLAQSGAARIMAVVQKLESWYQTLPETLVPSKIVFPSHLKIHLHYCHALVQLFEILAPEGRTRSQFVQFDEGQLFKSLSKYRAYFETILRIHYLRHSFEYGNMMLTRFLAMLAFLTLSRLDHLAAEPLEVLRSTDLDVGDADPKEIRATLIIAQKGLSDQGRGYYLPNILLRDVLEHMTASDAAVLQSVITIKPESPDESRQRKMYLEGHCPPDILQIAHDPSQQPNSNWIRRFAIMTLGEKLGRSILGMMSGGKDG
ncbi:unnamed protein product [Fusarium equiseti]|uniref:Zn(2)-C6 fungal-type domain-containing protein n=1 Tax=Fusarium equiseti TaxID=61235 RepID=A0A8J2JEC6_FUSEQ|nr:unnamed protein product [Fusarium equiseti]